MKKISILLLLVLLLSFVSCNQELKYWKFEYNCSEITEIKIINIPPTLSITSDHKAYPIIKQLDLSVSEQLYADIEKLPMKKYGFNLAEPYGNCFIIVYKNGDFDIISALEPTRFRYDEKYSRLQPYISWLKCDEEKFNLLIDKYLNMEQSIKT